MTKTAQGRAFNSGKFVTNVGYFDPVFDLLTSNPSYHVELLVLKSGKLLSATNSPQEDSEIPESLKIGVFTAKGGVGKTTVCIHLAGAFALKGREVLVVDLDPQRNLYNLLAEKGLLVRKTAHEPGMVITVIAGEDWSPQDFPQKVVMFDCPPVLDKRAHEVIKSLDYCIIPINLSPLSLSKNGEVVLRTINEIRQFNENAFVFVVINNYMAHRNRAEKSILQEYRNLFAINQDDMRFHMVDIDQACIRFSRNLYYWGHEIYTNINRTVDLAFLPHADRSNPQYDFLALADYLIAYTKEFHERRRI
ncbi:MAG: ParA family protein [Candidatus Lambdaproteobacteria bacterium]|nr:ParA family protein [Candidatus Lambdaproteobacteria bacterium]